MKDVELLAESIARDAAFACAASVIRRAVEKQGVNSLPKAEAVLRLKELETEHVTRAIDGMIAHHSELKTYLSMPPINPS